MDYDDPGCTVVFLVPVSNTLPRLLLNLAIEYWSLGHFGVADIR